MEGILCLGDFLNLVGRPAFLACPCCGLSFSNDFLELLIEVENENTSDRFLPITCSNCDKEMSVVDLITYA